MEKSLALSEKLALKNYIKKGYKNIAKAYGLNKEYAKAYEFLQYYAARNYLSVVHEWNARRHCIKDSCSAN